MGSSPELAALPRLYLITDRHTVAGGDLVAALAAAVHGGVRLVQLREKDLPLDELRALANEIRGVLRSVHGRWLVNVDRDRARLELARELGADGVHLTSTSPVDVHEVRERLGGSALVGISTHSIVEIERAAERRADFATFGPVFATPSKAGLGEPVGAAAVERAVRAAPALPVFALGGIDVHQLDEVMGTGVYGVAMIRACLAARDPSTASRSIIDRLARFDRRAAALSPRART